MKKSYKLSAEEIKLLKKRESIADSYTLRV